MLLLLKTTALLLVGAAVAFALRRASSGARHLVWLATLAGVLVLPPLARLAPLHLEVLPRGFLAPAEPVPAAEARPLRPEDSTSRAQDAPLSTARSSLRVAAHAAPAAGAGIASGLPGAPSVRAGLLAVWIVVGLGVLAYLAMGAYAVRRIVRTARPLDGPEWASLLSEAADRLDLAELPNLVASDRAGVPFACGAWRATVVLPTGAAEWSEERRRLVLFHELAHVKRRDLLGHSLGRLACAVYWFHPLVWSAARRLRAESERACDDLVLACGNRASDYAEHLLDIVAPAQRGGVPVTALPIARRKEFEGRMLAILDPGLRRGRPRPMHAAVLVVGVATLVVTVAASAPARPTASEPTPAAPKRPRPAAPAVHESATRREEPETPDADRDEHLQNENAADDERPRPIDPSRRATLLRVLRTDADASVRRTAAWALAQTHDAAAVAGLVAALRGDTSSEVREMAAWALADAAGPESSAVLTEALRGGRVAEVRATAAWALGQRRLADTATLAAALSDSSPKVREIAIWAIGNQRLAKAPDGLGAALRDDDTSVRLVAAWALGEICDAATAPALRAAFEGEKDDEVRRAVFRALMLLGDPPTDVLERALSAKDPELRSRAVQLFAGHGSSSWIWHWPRPEHRHFP
jgi:beta-lactamase regulating signal transducer with metallopeptidase domain